MKYALFLGCLISAREPSYELYARKVLPHFDIELVDIPETTCCAPFSIQSLDYIGWLAIAARNLAIAEEIGLPVLAFCNDCYESLLMTSIILRDDPELKTKVNDVLSQVGKEYKGKTEVKHLLEVLHQDVGAKKIKDTIKRPLTELKVATQTGCHAVRPKMIHPTLAVSPKTLDELVKATGAETVDYDKKEVCCGGPLRGINDEISRNLARQKLKGMKKAGANCIVTVCPFCFIQLDLGQLEIKRFFGEEYNLPVFHFVELLSLATGLEIKDWKMRDHRIPLNPLYEKLRGG
ncbi:MAG: CoB--CoM heterodisulfide reductase iron-sulfur subunit B family protein [Candidatus Bathyarchaeota archaeon]|nr:CoB--CoM heterodisulfide reductase iron-sulfur subunit B family protein [Candidatus Bathyarchaeota archaeon]